jgi:hypothetical protein
MVYLITYDLNAPGKNYEALKEAVKSCSTGLAAWCRYWDSTFLLRSDKSAKEIARKLSSVLDSNDAFLVIEVNENYSGRSQKAKWDYIRKLFH